MGQVLSSRFSPEISIVTSLEGLPGLVELANRVYGWHPDVSELSYHCWLYGENPAGPAIQGVAMLHGSMVAHYALIPMELQMGPEVVLAGLGVNAMTQREAEGRGLFAKLAAEVNRAAAARGLRVTYVVPGPNSAPWFSTILRYKTRGGLAAFARPERVLRLLADLGGAAWAALPVGLFLDPLVRLSGMLWRARRGRRQFAIRSVAVFGPEFDELWDRIGDQWHHTAVRSGRFLRWRYTNVPTRRYETLAAYRGDRLVGYVICRVRETQLGWRACIGSIVDIVAEPSSEGDNSAALLVAEAVRRLTGQGVNAIIAQLSLPSRFSYALRRNGFWRIPKVHRANRPILFLGDADASKGTVHFTAGDYDMG